MELVPTELLEAAGRGFGYGCKKYGDWNWAKGFPWLQPYASLMRHLSAWHGGEDLDKESGCRHLDLAACNLAMLLHFLARGIGEDNRLVRKREEWAAQVAQREYWSASPTDQQSRQPTGADPV